MAITKSELYSSLWSSCDELRGGMDASQYKDYVLVLLFIKYISDKYAGQPYAPITIPPGASFKDMVALKGKSDIGDQINKKIIAPLAKALGPGGRLIAIHSHGNDPGMEIIREAWPDDNPFIHNRHQILKAVKHELGPAGRDLNFNAYADNRSLFRYDMHTLPSEISESIGTSTLFAAWNAAVYVAQIDDERLAEVAADRRYLDATREVLQACSGLWFLDESYVVSRKRG